MIYTVNLTELSDATLVALRHDMLRLCSDGKPRHAILIVSEINARKRAGQFNVMAAGMAARAVQL